MARWFRWFYNSEDDNQAKGYEDTQVLMLEIESRQKEKTTLEEKPLDLPSHLEKLKDQYEVSLVDAYDKYSKKYYKKRHKLVNLLSDANKYVPIIQNESTEHYDSMLKRKKNKAWFILGSTLLFLFLAMLDYVPTFMIFQPVLESAVFGFMDRDIAISLITFAVVILIAILGHLKAMNIENFSEKSSRVTSYLIIGVFLLFFLSASYVRYEFEVKQKTDDFYTIPVKKATKKYDVCIEELSFVDAKNKSQEKARCDKLETILDDTKKEGKDKLNKALLEIITSSLLFTLISLGIFVIAYLSTIILEHGDLKHIFRRLKFRELCRDIEKEYHTCELIYHDLKLVLEGLRQSAQRERDEYLIGFEKGFLEHYKTSAHNEDKFIPSEILTIKAQLIKKFNENLALPSRIVNNNVFNENMSFDKLKMVEYKDFKSNLTEFEFFDAGYKDAINCLKYNPESVAVQEYSYSKSEENFIQVQLHNKYNSGYLKGVNLVRKYNICNDIILTDEELAQKQLALQEEKKQIAENRRKEELSRREEKKQNLILEKKKKIKINQRNQEMQDYYDRKNKIRLNNELVALTDDLKDLDEQQIETLDIDEEIKLENEKMKIVEQKANELESSTVTKVSNTGIDNSYEINSNIKKEEV